MATEWGSSSPALLGSLGLDGAMWKEPGIASCSSPTHGAQQCWLLSWPGGDVHPERGTLLIPNVLWLALIPLLSLPLIPKLPSPLQHNGLPRE